MDANLGQQTRKVYALIKIIHHQTNVSPNHRKPKMITKLTDNLTNTILPAYMTNNTKEQIRDNAKQWGDKTMQILRNHYQTQLREVVDQIKADRNPKWTHPFEIAKKWAYKNLTKIKPETLTQVWKLLPPSEPNTNRDSKEQKEKYINANTGMRMTEKFRKVKDPNIGGTKEGPSTGRWRVHHSFGSCGGNPNPNPNLTRQCLSPPGGVPSKVPSKPPLLQHPNLEPKYLSKPRIKITLENQTSQTNKNPTQYKEPTTTSTTLSKDNNTTGYSTKSTQTTTTQGHNKDQTPTQRPTQEPKSTIQNNKDLTPTQRPNKEHKPTTQDKDKDQTSILRTTKEPKPTIRDNNKDQTSTPRLTTTPVQTTITQTHNKVQSLTPKPTKELSNPITPKLHLSTSTTTTKLTTGKTPTTTTHTKNPEKTHIPIQPVIQNLAQSNKQFQDWQQIKGTYKYNPRTGTFTMEPTPIQSLTTGNQQFKEWQKTKGTYKYNPNTGTFTIQS